MTTEQEAIDEKPPLDDREIPAVSIDMTMSGKLFQQLVQYQIIVEMWSRLQTGRVRRAYDKEFSPEERLVLTAHHARCRRWHLQEGLPLEVKIKPATLELLQRAVNFFATI